MHMVSSVILGYQAPPQRKHQIARLEQLAEIAACGSGVCVPMARGGGRYWVANKTMREKMLDGEESAVLDSTNAYAVSVLHNTCTCPVFQCVCKHVLYARQEHLRRGFAAEWADPELSHMAPTEFINGARESPMEMLTRVKIADAAASREVPADVNAAVASQLTALSAVVTLAMDALPAALARLQILEDTPLPDNAPISDVLQRKLALATFDRVLVVTRTAGDAAAAAAGTGLGGARQQRKRRSARSSTEVSDDRLQARSLRLPAGAAPENYLGSSAHGGTVTFSFQVGRLPARRPPRLVQAKAVGWRRSISDEAGAAATAGVCALNLSAPVSLKRKTGDGGVRQAASKRSRL